MAVPESFVTWLKLQVEALAGRWQLTPEHAFAVWATMYTHEGLEEQQAVQCCDTIDGGHGDGGIDGRFDDDIAEIFVLNQAKFPNDPLNARIGIADRLRDLPSTVHSMLVDGPAGLPPKREAICEELQDAVDQGRSLVIEYYLAGTVSDQTRAEIDRLVSAIPGAEAVVYGLDELYSLYVSRELEQDLSGVQVKFPLAVGNYYEVPVRPSGIESAVCVALDARGLGKAAHPHGSRLFSLNVRYELQKTNKYNLQMKETLNSHPDSFWYYNNGITVVCDDWSIDANCEVITVTNPQVVNGCQTVSAIVARRNGVQTGAALVQARFIRKTQDSSGTEQAQRIAEYTNSQTHVKPADLRANEALQAEFQARFNLLPGDYFYERKRGEWDQLDSEVRRRITTARKLTMANVGQRYYAWEGCPAAAISEKGKLFDNLALHRQVYRLDVDPMAYLLAHEVFAFFDGLLSTSKRTYLLEINVLTATDILRLERAKKYFASHATRLARELLERKFGPVSSSNAAEVRDYFLRADVQAQLARYVSMVFHQFLNSHQANHEDAKKLLASDATSTQELSDNLVSTLNMLPPGIDPLPNT